MRVRGERELPLSHTHTQMRKEKKSAGGG
jgi:hypothetical protein